MNKKKIIGIVLGLFLLGGCCNSISNSNDNIDNNETKQENVKNDVKEDNRTEIELSDGNYVAGEDFVEGKYDIVAIKGSGNVSSSDMFSGGLNSVMASKDKIDELNKCGLSSLADTYQTNFKNAKLKKGVELNISNGVTIKLIPVKQ